MPAFKKVTADDSITPKTPLKMNKTINVPDEKLQRHLEKKRSEEKKTSAAMTFEEFEAQYADHLAGNVDPALRTIDRPDTRPSRNEDDDEGIEKSKASPKNKRA